MPYRMGPAPTAIGADVNDVENAVLYLMRDRFGKSAAIQRPVLEAEVALLVDGIAEVDDRQVREAIEWLRQNDRLGAWIISDPGYSGYWLAVDLDEVKSFVDRKRRTAAKMFSAARSQLRLAAIGQGERERVEAVGQIDLFR